MVHGTNRQGEARLRLQVQSSHISVSLAFQGNQVWSFNWSSGPPVCPMRRQSRASLLTDRCYVMSSLQVRWMGSASCSGTSRKLFAGPTRSLCNACRQSPSYEMKDLRFQKRPFRLQQLQQKIHSTGSSSLISSCRTSSNGRFDDATTLARSHLSS